MATFLRLLLVFLFALAACEDPLENTSNPEGNTNRPDTIADTISADSVPADSISNDSTPPPSPPPTDTVITTPGYYYPPIAESGWETISANSLGWNQDSLMHLLSFVQQKNTNAFIILHRGRIVTEKYWNNWDASTKNIIASAGKGLTAFLVGLAQEEGLLKIDKKTADFLGAGWTSLPAEKENLITIRHHLTMTTGLNEAEDMCQDPTCLTYTADAGARWAYHNGPYNLLNKIISIASGTPLNDFTKTRLADKIGLRNWAWENDVLSLSARDMARFGLLVLSKGKWDGKAIMQDESYFNAMVSPSNDFNESYGYLWWLNGQNSFMIPEDGAIQQGPLVPTAPPDMFAAMGKGDKKIYIVPSLDVVIVRHGEDTGEHTFGPSSFDSELWRRLAGVIN